MSPSELLANLSPAQMEIVRNYANHKTFYIEIPVEFPRELPKEDSSSSSGVNGYRIDIPVEFPSELPGESSPSELPAGSSFPELPSELTPEVQQIIADYSAAKTFHIEAPVEIPANLPAEPPLETKLSEHIPTQDGANWPLDGTLHPPHILQALSFDQCSLVLKKKIWSFDKLDEIDVTVFDALLTQLGLEPTDNLFKVLSVVFADMIFFGKNEGNEKAVDEWLEEHEEFWTAVDAVQD
jgi:hypothetical protein